MEWTKEQAIRAQDLRSRKEFVAEQIATMEEQYKAAKGAGRSRITKCLKPYKAEREEIKEELKTLPPPPMSEEEAINRIQEDLEAFCKEYEAQKAEFVEQAMRSPAGAVEWASKEVIVAEKQYELLARAIRKWDGTFQSLKEVLEEMQAGARERVAYYDPTSGSTCLFHRAVNAAEYLARAALAGSGPGSFHLRYLLSYKLERYAEVVRVWQMLQEEETA